MTRKKAEGGGGGSGGGDALAVAVIGSSGGGTATLGHTDAPALLETVHRELRSLRRRRGTPGAVGTGAALGDRDSDSGACCVGIRYALYVVLDGGKSLDAANDGIDTATLYEVNTDEQSERESPSTSSSSSSTRREHRSILPFCRIVKKGTLKQVNEYCGQRQRQIIARAVQEGRVSGLVCISCSPAVFRQTLEAAAEKNLPVTGSGGTSLSQASALYGVRLVGNAGGSVATTSYTRAVSYAHALASYWNVPYRPWEGRDDGDGARRRSSFGSGGPSVVSVLNACLPAFWGVCLAKQALQAALSAHGHMQADDDDDDDDNYAATIRATIFLLENSALPTACAAIMATSSCRSDTANSSTSLIMSAVIASSSCSRSVLGGLLAGWLIAKFSERLLYYCIFNNVPATMTNLVTAGGIGAFVAVMMHLVSPLLRWLTAQIRASILSCVTRIPSSSILLPLLPPIWKRTLVGAFLGVLSCYGSKVGYYHAIHLPLILVEMETGDASFLGAVDELTLVLVCSGICFGNLAARATFCGRSPKHKHSRPAGFCTLTDADASLCWRGLRINISCGDFIEACYPFMEKSWIINAGGYLGSAFSAAWLVMDDVHTPQDVPKSLAYLPLPVSIALAGRHWSRFAIASVLAVGIPTVATMLHHVVERVKNNKS